MEPIELNTTLKPKKVIPPTEVFKHDNQYYYVSTRRKIFNNVDPLKKLSEGKYVLISDPSLVPLQKKVQPIDPVDIFKFGDKYYYLLNKRTINDQLSVSEKIKSGKFILHDAPGDYKTDINDQPIQTKPKPKDGTFAAMDPKTVVDIATKNNILMSNKAVKSLQDLYPDKSISNVTKLFKRLNTIDKVTSISYTSKNDAKLKYHKVNK